MPCSWVNEEDDFLCLPESTHTSEDANTLSEVNPTKFHGKKLIFVIFQALYSSLALMSRLYF